MKTFGSPNSWFNCMHLRSDQDCVLSAYLDENVGDAG